MECLKLSNKWFDFRRIRGKNRIENKPILSRPTSVGDGYGNKNGGIDVIQGCRWTFEDSINILLQLIVN